MVTEVSSLARRGYLFAFLAAICGGAIPTLSKVLLAQLNPLTISGYSFLLSGLMIFPIKPGALPTRKSFPFLVFFGLLGAAVAPVIYLTGLNLTTAVNTSLLANGELLFTSLIAFAIFGERLTRRQLAVGLLIVAGILIVSTGLSFGGVSLMQGLIGNILVLVATLGWSVENNLIISAARRFGTARVTKFRNIIGGGFVVVVVTALGFQLGLTSFGYFALILLALSLAATSYLAIAALSMIGAIRSILVFSTTSIFGALYALVYLGEGISAAQLLGGALILAGVYLFQRSESRSVPTMDPSGKEFT